MTNEYLYSQISGHFWCLKGEVAEFIELIKVRERSNKPIKERKFGIAKGLIEIARDFDQPMEDFKDYM